MKRNVGKIELDSIFMGAILDFEGLIIHSAEVTKFNTLSLIVEHPDLPLVSDGEALQTVWVAMKATYGDNGVITKLERYEPPKTTCPLEKDV
uniref:Uncharacterized protein n=1 Tax=viral metagenome TaxID=1070528 RepID=A0A6M3L504_9ZZZZ